MKDRKQELGVGFSSVEQERIKTHLERLLPHFREGGFAIVGGVAIRHHMISRGYDYPLRDFNDLDLIVRDSQVVRPTVAQDFLIYHYHPVNYFLALVDPITKTKVDVFTWDPAPQRLSQIHFGDRILDMVSIEDQLVKTVLDIQRISEEAKVDPKQFFDTQMLIKVADLNLTDKLWRDKHYDKWPASLADAIARAEHIALEHPEWVQEKPFRKPLPYKCSHCQNANGFEIEPMENIYKVLGYIE